MPSTIPQTIPFVIGSPEEGGEPPALSPVAHPPGATVDVTVRLQALDGTWETCGADRAIKVAPETLQMSANEWGPDKASFNLHRSPIAIWPDIGAFSPVEIEVGGVVVWEGRTDDTPLRSGAEQIINVQCNGYQYHLDDDVYQRAYVHSKLTDWKDSRSFPTCDLAARYLTSGSVQVAQGRVTLGYAKGAQVINGQCVGVTLDLGPQGPGAVFVAVDTELVAGGGAFTFYAIGHNGFTPGSETWIERLDAVAGAGLSTGTYSGSLASPRRYISLMVYEPGEAETRAADLTFVIKAVRVFTSTAFETAGVSTLKASTIVPDALERATMLLSPDFSQIAATTFAIPDFTLGKMSTPREAIEAANAYHNWVSKVQAGKRVSFQPRPTDATLEIGAWSGASLEDASANSGAEIYNRAVIEATGADGTPLVVERTASQQAGVMPLSVSSPSPDNPSFTVDTASWTTPGTITRTTAAENVHSAPGAGEWTPPNGAFKTLTETFTGTFLRGVVYGLTLFVKSAGPGNNPLGIKFGTAEDNTVSVAGLGAGYQALTVAWTPTKTVTGVSLTLTASSESILWIDDLTLATAEPTLVDRRGFRRTKVIQMSSAITPTEGNQLGDIFLQAHMTTPFKGSAAVSPGGVRRVLGGQPIHPSLLLLHTQELLRLAHLVDPDTGGVSRDGTIAEVTYTHKDQKAAVVLDDKRGNFDALLNRLAVVQSVGS